MTTEPSATAGQTEARLRQLAYQFLVHSFLYYRLGESVIEDAAFDRMADDLRRLREAHPAAAMPHANLIDPVLGPEASGHQVRDYPPEIITLSFQLLYGETHPEVEFEEFVERRGYRVSHEGDPAP
jgi:NAD-dependent DNA ligase